MVDLATSKKEHVKAIYDEYSSTFDEAVGQLMTWWVRLLLREISVLDNPVCLDVGQESRLLS